MKAPETADRCNSREAAALLGLSIRKVQEMAVNGRLPGAAFYAGRWTFDRAKLARFIADEEAEIERGAHYRPKRRSYVGSRSSGAELRAAAGVGPSLKDLIRQSQDRAKRKREG